MMGRLKLGALVEDKPVKISVELPAAIYRDLVAYAAVHGAENEQPNQPPEKLVAPILAIFIGADREFAKARRVLSSA